MMSKAELDVIRQKIISLVLAKPEKAAVILMRWLNSSNKKNK